MKYHRQLRRMMPLGALIALANGCGSSNPTGPAARDSLLVSWSRITGHLAYSRYCPSPSCSVLLLADGTTQQIRTVYTSSDSVSGINNLAWTPTGNIGYDGLPIIPLGFLTVYTINPAGGPPTTIEAGNAFPTWSASGHLAANATDYLLSVDGKVDSTITVNFTRAAWMPDGTHLIASLDNLFSPDTLLSVLGQGSLYLQSTTDTASRVLLRAGSRSVYFDDPVVSPDGLHVAFTLVNYPSETTSIWVMRVDGTGAIALTAGPNDYEPSWSPDGKQIAFIRGGNQALAMSEYHVFVMNADGTNQAQVTSGSALDVSWGP